MKSFHKITTLVIFALVLSFCGGNTPTSDNGETGSTNSSIKIKHGSSFINSGTSNYSIGNAVVNTTRTISFSIENFGNGELKMTNNPRVVISGSHCSLAQDAPESIASAQSGTFSIRFFSSQVKTATCEISIANNSSNAPNYTFSFQVQVTAIPEPKIRIQELKTQFDPISNNNSSNPYSIGSSQLSVKKTITFLIENIGAKELTLNGNPSKVTITNTNDSAFSLESDAASSIVPPYSNTTFQVSFTPTNADLNIEYKSTISIENDDENQNI